jgi:drug/metabolite transporter (DMT)-like permease
MNRTLTTVVFGLAASLSWGSGDFNGGLASRRSPAASVATAAYSIGFVLLIGIALIVREPLPSTADVFWGGLAGVAGAVGLIAFYSALSIGRMGLAAPISAVLTAGLPVIFSAFTEGLPGPLQLGGFVLALLAIALISRPERSKGRPEGIGLALLAGCGFGAFFILISRVSATETYWPLAVARFTAILFLLAFVWLRRQPALPAMKVAPFVLLAGVLDAFGNVFFVFATHSGRLDVAAVLSSLYPAATVLLAMIVLRERATRLQALGILLALIAVPLISV